MKESTTNTLIIAAAAIIIVAFLSFAQCYTARMDNLTAEVNAKKWGAIMEPLNERQTP